MLLLVLAVPFIIYNQVQRTNKCEASGGVLVKSGSGWTCIEVKRI